MIPANLRCFKSLTFEYNISRPCQLTNAFLKLRHDWSSSTIAYWSSIPCVTNVCTLITTLQLSTSFSFKPMSKPLIYFSTAYHSVDALHSCKHTSQVCQAVHKTLHLPRWIDEHIFNIVVWGFLCVPHMYTKESANTNEFSKYKYLNIDHQYNLLQISSPWLTAKVKVNVYPMKDTIVPIANSPCVSWNQCVRKATPVSNLIVRQDCV